LDSRGTCSVLLPGSQHNFCGSRVVKPHSVGWTSPSGDYVGFGAVAGTNKAGRGPLDIKSAAQVFMGRGAGDFQNAGSLPSRATVPVAAICILASKKSGLVTRKKGDIRLPPGLHADGGKTSISRRESRAAPLFWTSAAALGRVAALAMAFGRGRTPSGQSASQSWRLIPNWNPPTPADQLSRYTSGRHKGGVNYDRFSPRVAEGRHGQLRRSREWFEPTCSDVFEIMREVFPAREPFNATKSHPGFATDYVFRQQRTTCASFQARRCAPQCYHSSRVLCGS